MMTRVTLHAPDDRRNIHEWWRVRDEGTGKVTMTWKRNDSDTVDGTRELEIEVSNFETAVQILLTTGLELVARQESYRETWVKDEVEVVIDEWPGLRPFIEIEGPGNHLVEAAAKALGFSMDQAIFGGVGKIYQMELGYVPEVVNNWPVISFVNPPKRLGHG
jgi:adenylate cyclase class 2